VPIDLEASSRFYIRPSRDSVGFWNAHRAPQVILSRVLGQELLFLWRSTLSEFERDTHSMGSGVLPVDLSDPGHSSTQPQPYA
jgi:hypothetical protein